MGCESPEQAIAEFRQMMKEMDLKNPVAGSREEELNLLSTSVNPVRLKNNPVALEKGVIYQLYSRIVN
jgi:hypothetical protein